MADLTLTTDFTQLNNMNKALEETASTVERRVNPVLQRLQENLQFQERVNQQLTQSNQVLARSFTMNEIQQAATRMQNYEQALAHSREGMNSFGVVTQQAGYQIGDFLVQVQSGTNWLVAFGQQATQLVGILPMMTGFMGLSTGALVALSAGLGIAIPLVTAIGAAYMRMSESADSAASSVMTLAKAQEQLNQASADYALKLEMLRFGVDTQAEAFALKEIYDLTVQIQRLNREYQQTDSLSRRQAIAEEVLGLKEQLSIQQGIVDEVNSKRQAYETALAINKQMQAVELAHARAIGDAKREQEAMTEAAQDALGKYSMMRTVAAGIANEMARAAANTQAAANAALTAMRMEFSPAGGAMSQYAGRGADSNRPLTDQYGNVISLPGSERPSRRPNDIDFGISGVSGGGGGGAAQEDALQKLREQVKLENELLGLSEAQERVIRALGDQRGKYSEAEINAITAEIEAYNLKLEAIKQQEQLAKTMQSSMEDAFMSIVSGTESAKDAFKKMAYQMIQELYRVLVVQRLVGQFQGGGGGILGALFGRFGARASGGSIMPNQPYLVGEHGPELVIPRHSGTVVNANQTAGAVGGSGTTVVNNNISVTGSDAAMVRAEVAKMIPQITNATKAAVIDARLRGGQMKAAFG